MNNTFEEADDLLNDLVTGLENIILDRNTHLVVCPPFPFLEIASDLSEESYFLIGGQDVSTEEKGAYTGDVSAAMLKSIGLEYCIVGHSERRQYHHETNDMVARKVDMLLKYEIQPIVCCGERLEER